MSHALGSANLCRQKRGELFFLMLSMHGTSNKSALRIALACAALFAAAGQAAVSEDFAGLVDIGGFLGFGVALRRREFSVADLTLSHVVDLPP